MYIFEGVESSARLYSHTSVAPQASESVGLLVARSFRIEYVKSSGDRVVITHRLSDRVISVPTEACA
jgi:hypothetical protein